MLDEVDVVKKSVGVVRSSCYVGFVLKVYWMKMKRAYERLK